MNDPDIKKRSAAAAKRRAWARSTITFAIVLVVTAFYGGIAFVLIGSTKTAAISVALIFLAAVTVRVLERE
jgi:hypothetical protein